MFVIRVRRHATRRSRFYDPHKRLCEQIEEAVECGVDRQHEFPPVRRARICSARSPAFVGKSLRPDESRIHGINRASAYSLSVGMLMPVSRVSAPIVLSYSIDYPLTLIDSINARIYCCSNKTH